MRVLPPLALVCLFVCAVIPQAASGFERHAQQLEQDETLGGILTVDCILSGFTTCSGWIWTSKRIWASIPSSGSRS